MNKIIFALIFITLACSVVASAQDDLVFADAYWDMEVSNRVIAIGETLWINVSGIPRTSFDIVFTLTGTNETNEVKYDGYTNITGNQTMEFDLELTRDPGTYIIALVVNDTVYSWADLDIRWDETHSLKLDIHDIKRELATEKSDKEAMRIEIGQLIVEFRKDRAGLTFLFCYAIITTTILLHFFGPFFINYAIKWNTERQYVAEHRDKNKPHPNDQHFTDYGGTYIKQQGEMATVGDDFPEEYQEIRGKNHDQFLEYLKECDAKGDDYRKISKMPKPPLFAWRMLKIGKKADIEKVEKVKKVKKVKGAD